MSWDRVEDDIDSGPAGFAKWIVVFIIFVCVVMGGISYFSVNAERVIVESSYIYKAGARAEVATYQATLEELDIRIAQDPINQDLINQRSFVRSKLKSLEI